MIRTETYNTNKSPATIILLAILFVLASVATIVWLEKPIKTMTQEADLETVYAPTFNLSVTASGDVEVSLPTDNTGMPDCKSLGIEGCDWESKLRRKVDGSDNVIETTLKRDGKVIGRVQVMELDTIEYEQLETLNRAGYEKAWISHVEVEQAFRGNGLGRSLWHASDAMIKTLVGPGQAIHIFVDQAGWGETLMQDIAKSDIILAVDNYWAYIVR